MIINIVYLAIGFLIGFLIKYEIDIKQRKKRIEKQKLAIAKKVEVYDETLLMIRELNESLTTIQNTNQKRGVH
jgi:uncharacterized membrane protein YqgA involved in biofilm formation